MSSTKWNFYATIWSWTIQKSTKSWKAKVACVYKKYCNINHVKLGYLFILHLVLKSPLCGVSQLSAQIMKIFFILHLISNHATACFFYFTIWSAVILEHKKKNYIIFFQDIFLFCFLFVIYIYIYIYIYWSVTFSSCWLICLV